jgi:putative salt-induced outer membrane protein YdiY
MLSKMLVAGSLSVALVAGAVWAAEAVSEEKPASSSIALGLTVNEGNTDNSMFNAAFTYDRKLDEKNSVRLALDAAYGETDNDKTTDNANAAFDYRHLLSDRAYAALNASYKTDDIADLDYRWVVSPGLGYFLMKNDQATLGVETGPAVVGEKKGGETTEDIALRVAERYERSLSTNARVWQSAEYLPKIDDFDTYLLNLELGVEAPLSEKINVRLVARNAYDSDPAPGRDDNDLTVIGALSYTLF